MPEIERPRTPLWLVLVVGVLAVVGLLAVLRAVLGAVIWLAMVGLVVWLVVVLSRSFTRR